MAPKANKLSAEEELLLQDFSRNVSTKSSALFYGNALIVSSIPIWLFWRVHQMDLAQSAIMFVIGSLVSAYFVAMAYKNVKFVLKHKIALKREEAVSREMMRQLAEDKRMTKKEKD